MIAASPTPADTSLIYLAPGDVLKGRVEPTIWMRMCHAYGGLGIATELVTLYTYRAENVRRKDLFSHYGIPDPRFKLKILPTPLMLKTPLVWYRTATVTANWFHSLSKLARCFGNGHRGLLVFHSRSPAAMFPYLHMRPFFEKVCKVLYVFETHVLPTSRLPIDIIREADGVIVSSDKLAKDMQTRLGIPAERIETAYLASNALPTHLSRSEACQQLGLRPDKRYIIYTGKLLMPEVNLLLDAAARLAMISPEAEVVFVGGNPQILAECHSEVTRRRLRNVRFTGFVAPSQVGLYQVAADILVLCLAKDRDIIDYITPSKVFDYLQAGHPIVISDFPILHEILDHERNALFVRPHAPEEFADAIKRVLDDPVLASRLSEGAILSSHEYSWEKRVQLIWRFIERLYALKYAA